MERNALTLRHLTALYGQTLVEAGLGRDLDLTVLELIRGEDRNPAPRADMRLEAGDVLLVEGRREAVLNLKWSRPA